MFEARRPYRIFVSGNCQMQFVADSLRQVFGGQPDIAVSFSAAYRPVRDGDSDFA